MTVFLFDVSTVTVYYSGPDRLSKRQNNTLDTIK